VEDCPSRVMAFVKDLVEFKAEKSVLTVPGHHLTRLVDHAICFFRARLQDLL
jgi:hypothetical protein